MDQERVWVEQARRGDQAAFDAAQPVAMAFSRAFTLLGASGSGQLAKMVNQICIAGLVQGLSEAVAFGQNAGSFVLGREQGTSGSDKLAPLPFDRPMLVIDRPGARTTAVRRMQ